MTVLIVLGVIAAVIALAMLRRGHETSLKLTEIPAVFERLKTTGKDASFAQFCFGAADKTVEDNAVNVQFSIEGDRIGCDWCLLCPLNIRDKGKFTQLAERRGQSVSFHKAKNGCEYLRVEDGDLVGLCTASIRELYGLSETATVGMVWEGFIWP